MRYRNGLPLVQVMAVTCSVPSHYLGWFIINSILGTNINEISIEIHSKAFKDVACIMSAIFFLICQICVFQNEWLVLYNWKNIIKMAYPVVKVSRIDYWGLSTVSLSNSYMQGNGPPLSNFIALLIFKTIPVIFWSAIVILFIKVRSKVTTQKLFLTKGTRPKHVL